MWEFDFKDHYKNKKHSSIVATKQKCSSKSRFSLFFVEKSEIKKEIDWVHVNITVQHTNIPTKIIKKNSDLVFNFIFQILMTLLLCQFFWQL